MPGLLNHIGNQQLLFIGGKGGVGKTTTTAAIALSLADTRKVRLVSTDPAHSLSDLLSDTEDNIELLEIDASEELSAFKEKHEGELLHFFDTSTYFDGEDQDQFLKLSIPGIDEIMGFKKVIDLTTDYEGKVVVDTAPTGHTLRLLAAPDLLNDWIKFMSQMRWKYRYLKRVSGSISKDETDNFLMDLKRSVVRTNALMRDKSQSKFIMVSKPERMVVKETIRYKQRLEAMEIDASMVVINQVAPSDCDCAFCKELLKSQLPHISDLVGAFEVNYQVPQFPFEIQSKEELSQYSTHLLKTN